VCSSDLEADTAVLVVLAVLAAAVLVLLAVAVVLQQQTLAAAEAVLTILLVEQVVQELSSSVTLEHSGEQAAQLLLQVDILIIHLHLLGHTQHEPFC
jgi:hypothetical protein